MMFDDKYSGQMCVRVRATNYQSTFNQIPCAYIFEETLTMCLLFYH